MNPYAYKINGAGINIFDRNKPRHRGVKVLRDDLPWPVWWRILSLYRAFCMVGIAPERARRDTAVEVEVIKWAWMKANEPAKKRNP